MTLEGMGLWVSTNHTQRIITLYFSFKLFHFFLACFDEMPTEPEVDTKTLGRITAGHTVPNQQSLSNV